MKLSHNWITEGHLDFEYKKYVLLAYLQHVDKRFNNAKLYPLLTDLITHYNGLIAIRDNGKMVNDNLTKSLSKLDLEQFKVAYERQMDDPTYFDVIQSIVDFAIPRLQKCVDAGAELYDFVEQKISISPIGLVPINKQFGYLFLKQPKQTATQVYEYEITIFEHAEEQYRGIKTDFIETQNWSFTNTFEQMKLSVLNKIPKLPNPATFLVETGLVFPINETVLPIAKRSLVRYIASME